MRRAPRAAVSLGTAAAVLATACFSERPTAATDEAAQLAIAACRAARSGEAPPAGVVTIRNFRFTPDTLRVEAGDAVTWVNCEDASLVEAHTSTSDAGVWTSGALSPAAVYSRDFDQPGAFPYHCQPHPSMRAAVIVQ